MPGARSAVGTGRDDREWGMVGGFPAVLPMAEVVVEVEVGVGVGVGVGVAVVVVEEVVVVVVDREDPTAPVAKVSMAAVSLVVVVEAAVEEREEGLT